MCRFPLLIINLENFSMPNSIPMLWLYILTACIRISNSFSFLVVFVPRPTERESVAQGLFLVGPGAGP